MQLGFDLTLSVNDKNIQQGSLDVCMVELSAQQRDVHEESVRYGDGLRRALALVIKNIV